MKISQLFFLTVCLLLLVTGCIQRRLPEGMPPLYHVTLEFLQDDKPLAEASVILFPETENGKWFAGGVTDLQGKLKPMTLGRYQGVAAGKYKVTVSKFEVDEMSVKKMENSSVYEYYHLVDPQFAETVTTPLSLEISENNSTKTFNVGTAIRKKLDKETGP
jgi:hypothetical protein